jgi:hypothetical protein
MSSIFSSDTNISPPEISLGKDDKSFNFLMFIIVIIVFVIVVIPWDKLGKKHEGMSGGTVAQMFAQDSQDVYLKGNVDKIATGNFDLYWNQPTRQGMNVFQNRGYPLYSILLPDTPMNPNANILEVSNNYVDNIINNEVYKKENELTFSNPVLKLDDVLPSKTKPKINSLSPEETKDYETINGEEQEKTDYLTFPEVRKTPKLVKSNKISKSIPTIPKNILPSSLPISVVVNSNPYELSKVAKQVAKTKYTTDNLPALTQWTPENYLFQAYTDRAINYKNCLKDPASCTYGTFGGARLNDGFVQSTKSVSNVNLDGNYFYPDSYVGSYFTQPNFDINKPYPFIPNGNRV